MGIFSVITLRSGHPARGALRQRGLDASGITTLAEVERARGRYHYRGELHVLRKMQSFWTLIRPRRDGRASLAFRPWAKTMNGSREWTAQAAQAALAVRAEPRRPPERPGCSSLAVQDAAERLDTWHAACIRIPRRTNGCARWRRCGVVQRLQSLASLRRPHRLKPRRINPLYFYGTSSSCLISS